MSIVDTDDRGNGHRLSANKHWKIVGSILAGATILVGSAIVFKNDAYQDNLQMIRTQSVRNVNHDGSGDRDKKASEIVQANHLGARSDYLNNPNGNPEQSFPVASGGQFRTSCEFSHFAYDDPILYPDRPGAAHLHMFFGNTDVNAHTTQETLEDTGSSTCNGQELNRTGYWAPAMFDGNGNVRMPERIVVYYKGEGHASGGPNGNRPNYPSYGACGGCPNPGSQVYPRGTRNIAPNPISVPETSSNGGEVNYKCTNNYSVYQFADGVNSIPNCDGDYYQNTFGAAYPGTRTVLEMEVKFQNCFPKFDENNPLSGANPDETDWTLWQASANGGWFWSDCDGEAGPNANGDFETYPNMNYFVNYVVEPGEDTSDWFLASDVDPASIMNPNGAVRTNSGGAAHHGDVWWSWDKDTNQEWIDNCVNRSVDPTASGCGFGYLSDGGPNGNNPFNGPALKYRPQYDNPGDSSTYKYSASALFAEICAPLSPAHSFTNDESAAYCKP